MIRHLGRGVFFYDFMASNEATQGGGKTQSQQGLYAKFEPLVEPSIEKLKLLLESRNEAIALGAIKTILDRTLPIKKAVELTGQNGEPIKLNIIAGADFSQLNALADTSTGSATYGQPPLQGTGLAQTGSKDNDSNQPISEVVST